jgi:radical SAM superfamily enzyme YgiQ (UPF0313 family)
MKILLINPPRSPENNILAYAPEEAKHFIHKKLIGPPLGLLTIAAAVKDHDVMLIDLKGEYDLDPAAPELRVMVERFMREFRPDVLGVTFIASEFTAGIRIFEAAKAADPRVRTVAGGLHCTLCQNDFDLPVVDFVCRGQSAGMFQELIRVLETGKHPSSVGGLLFRDETGLFQESLLPPKPWDAAGNDFLFPDRDLLKRWISTYHVGGHPSPSTYLFTSLGCQYKCTFCSIWKQYCGGFSQRDTESIIRELKEIRDYDVVRFADANTIVNIDFIDRLFDRINEEGIRKEYIMDIRFDTASEHPKLIEKLARSGLKVVICGFESFRESELKKYRKGSSAKLIENAIEVFHQNGVMLRGNYVVPHDYSRDDFEALSDYASAHKVVYAGYTILTPMPGTDYYDEMKDQIIDTDLDKYNFFNCVLPTALPLEAFYREVGSLWLIKKGKDVI